MVKATSLIRRHLPHLQLEAVMISHGSIIANLNSSEVLGSFGPQANSVSLHLLHLAFRLAQPAQNGGAQQLKIPIRLMNIPICVVTGLHSCCLYPFTTPNTSVIITDRSVEATLETIARFAFQRFW